MVTWKDDRLERRECFTEQVRTQSRVSLTVKHSTAILSGGGQRLAGVVQFVAVVTDADLKLDWFTGVLNHGGTVEDCT